MDSHSRDTASIVVNSLHIRRAHKALPIVSQYYIQAGAYSTYTHALAVARAVMRVMRVEFHIGAAIKGVQPPEQALQRVGLEEGMVLGHAGNVYRELIVCKEEKESPSFLVC